MLRETRSLLSWEDFSSRVYTEPQFLINPYLARDGITFLWGETSTGKSPLGWHMAACVGEGRNFFGLPVSQGSVLYIEVDTPQRLVHERIRVLEPAKGVDFLFLPPLGIPNVCPEDLDLLQEAGKRGYDLVIINTLRKVHDLNDKEPQTVKLVYSFFQHLFPGSALVFVHHTKKTQVNPDGTEGRGKENFSGAMNWLNDAQVGVRLAPYVSDAEGVNIKLHHEKSQVSKLYGALGLWLNPTNGAELRCPKSEQLCYLYELLASGEHGGKALDDKVAKELGVSSTTVWRKRQLIEGGLFPGVEWLGTKAKDGGT
jgi:hypothetical protein